MVLIGNPAGQSINTNAKPLFASSTESLNTSITDKALPPSTIPYVTSRSYPIGSVTPNTEILEMLV